MKLNLPGRKIPARKATTVRMTAARKQIVEMMRKPRSTLKEPTVRAGFLLGNLCCTSAKSRKAGNALHGSHLSLLGGGGFLDFHVGTRLDLFLSAASFFSLMGGWPDKKKRKRREGGNVRPPSVACLD
jgi:hypothetical protein